MEGSKKEARISIKGTPGAKRNSISGFKEGVWYVKIAAPPVEGKANDELVTYLSDVLDVRKKSVSVVKGISSRLKLVSISGLSAEEVIRRLSAAQGK